MVELKAGSKFGSFAEFEEAFEQWKSAFFHPFRVASSETLRMPDGTANETFKYRYIVYHCAHYGAPRMRGAGKRPNQNYLPCGCRAMLRLNFSWSENALRITTLNIQHTGHEVDAESFARFAAKIRSRPSHNSSSSGTSSPRRSLPSSPSPSTPSFPAPTLTPTTTLLHPALLNSDGKPLTATGNRIDNGLPMNVNINNNLIVEKLIEEMKQGQKENADRRATGAPLAPNLGITECFGMTPLDLSAKHVNDTRSDEDRFQEMHATLQGLSDHLLFCKGVEFDGKLQQLKLLLKTWNLRP